MAVTNLKRCDSICFHILMISIVSIGFFSAIFRFAVSSEVIGYMLMGILVLVSIIRTILWIQRGSNVALVTKIKE